MTNPLDVKRLHEENRTRWNVASRAYQESIESSGMWRKLPGNPGLFFYPEEMEIMGDVKGKSAAVLGSGDNHAAFALAGMGAAVTSVDISEKQLAAAERRAGEIGLKISFVRADVTDLGLLKSGVYDLVYTGGHLDVWVADLDRFYAEATRILKVGGLFVVMEYHPIRRIFNNVAPLEVSRPYFNRGPHQYDFQPEFPNDTDRPTLQHEFTWTIGDRVTAMLAKGLRITAVKEMSDEREAWEPVDLSGLPRRIFIVGKKEA
jgi:SAM-dependent methyltransferase